MKRIIAIIALAIGLFLALMWGLSQRSEKLRHKDNYEAVTTDLGIEQQLKLSEIKKNEELSKINKLLKDSLGIKPKQIDHYIVGEIQYRDTGRIDTLLYGRDTTKVYRDSLHFAIVRPCYDLDILIYKGKATESLSYHDTITGTLYRERPHKFLFIKYGRWQHKGVFYSSCRGEFTIPNQNIKVVKKR